MLFQNKNKTLFILQLIFNGTNVSKFKSVTFHGVSNMQSIFNLTV